MTTDLNKQIAIASKIKGGLADFNDPDTKAYFIEKYAPGATDIELAEFIATAQSDEAVPGRDIYFMKFKKKDGSYYPATFVHSIHWMTRKANESGDFVGFTDPEFLDGEGTWHNAFWPHDQRKNVPVACKIGVIKKSTDKIGWSTVRWDERAKYFGNKLREQWALQGIHMITKCAKGQAYRDAGFVGARYLSEEIPEPIQNGVWEHTDGPVSDKLAEITKGVSDKQRARSGDLRASEELPVNDDDKAELKQAFKDMGLSGKDEIIPWVNEVMKGYDMPSIKKFSEITTKGQFEALIIAAKADITEKMESEDSDTEG